MTNHQIVAVAVSLCGLSFRCAQLSKKVEIPAWPLWIFGGYWLTVWIAGQVWTAQDIYHWGVSP